MHVVMMGGLHNIEMALWNTLGDVLEASGWTDALTEVEVASSGIADSFLKVAHLTQTWRAKITCTTSIPCMTQPQPSEERARNLHDRLGRHMRK